MVMTQFITSANWGVVGAELDWVQGGLSVDQSTWHTVFNWGDNDPITPTTRTFRTMVRT